MHVLLGSTKTVEWQYVLVVLLVHTVVWVQFHALNVEQEHTVLDLQVHAPHAVLGHPV